jgi:transposase-like protein
MYLRNLPAEKVKAGKSNDGIQRYKCLKTKKIYQETTTRTPVIIKYLSVFLYFNGLSYRNIGKMFDVSHTSISNWVAKISNEIYNNHELTDLQNVKDIEIDELFTFLIKKKINHTF